MVEPYLPDPDICDKVIVAIEAYARAEALDEATKQALLRRVLMALAAFPRLLNWYALREIIERLDVVEPPT